jgi:hypothetical protein
MTASLSEHIASGYQVVIERWPEDDLPALVRMRARDRTRSIEERDVTLREAVQAYRRGPRSKWGPVVLELLAPAILVRLGLFEELLPVIALEDLRQQLVVEVLDAAAHMPLADNARYIKQRVMRRAAKRMTRWLAREIRAASWRGPNFEDLPS